MQRRPARSEPVYAAGMRPEAELAAAYARAGFYAYPTDKAETSGIALMKAQACGCIPITSGQTVSALPETCGEWDLGPEGREGYIAQSAQWQGDYLDALIAAARRPAAEMRSFRQRMKGAARARFSWATVARQWHELFRPPATDGDADTPRPPSPSASPLPSDSASPTPSAPTGDRAEMKDEM